MSLTGHNLRRRNDAAENSDEAMEKRADVEAEASRKERGVTKAEDEAALAAEVAEVEATVTTSKKKKASK